MGVEWQIAFIVPVWNLIPVFARSHPNRGALLAWAVIGVIVASPGLRHALLGGYQDDSLFTLPPAHRTGVILIAAVLLTVHFAIVACVAGYMAQIASKPWERLVAVLGSLVTTCVIFISGFMIAPQVFYEYYLWIFAELPRQVVVSGQHLGDFAQAISLPPDGNLAECLAGAGFWAAVGLTLSIHARTWRNNADAAKDHPDI